MAKERETKGDKNKALRFEERILLDKIMNKQ